MVGCVPQSGQSGSRRMRISRNRMASASYISRRPTSGSPCPIISLIVSVAWMTPITPGNTPKTPTSLHDGTMPGGGWGRGSGSTALRAA